MKRYYSPTGILWHPVFTEYSGSEFGKLVTGSMTDWQTLSANYSAALPTRAKLSKFWLH